MANPSGCNYFGSICQSTCQFIANSCHSLASEMKTPSRLQGYTLIVGGTSMAMLGIQQGVSSIKGIYNRMFKEEQSYILYSEQQPGSNLLTKCLISITCLGLGGAAVVAGTINILMPEALNSGCADLKVECLQSHPSCKYACQETSDYAKDAAEEIVSEGAYRALCKLFPEIDHCKLGVG
ncbi:MAG: hypothetical protein WD595_06340 [Waddliaceae bacterium]